MVQPGHYVDGLLDWLRDRDEHLVDGEHAIIDTHDDAWKIRLWKDRHRNGKREISAYRDQSEDDEDDGLAVADRPVRRVGVGDQVAHLDLGLASSFFWSLANFSSGAFSSSSRTSFTVGSITLTLALSSRPMPPTITTSSPGRTPFRICTLSPSRTPSFTLRRCAMPSGVITRQAVPPS